MPGIEIVVDKLIKMMQYIEQLEIIKPASPEEYKRDITKKYAIERIIQLIVDLAIDINNIVLSYMKRPPAADYFNSFIDLYECGLLEQSFTLNIAPSTGLRNRLVHEYERINDEIVYESINEIIDMYNKYIAIVNIFIKTI